MSTPYLEHQVELGQTLLDRGLNHQAAETLREVLALDDHHPRAHALAAVALLRLNRVRAADHEAARATVCDPDCFEANAVTAEVRLAQGRLDEAQQALTWCIDHRPGHGASLATLGRLRVAQGRPDEAKTVFEDALAAEPDRREAIVGLGELAFDRGDADAATAHAEAALQIDPDHPAALVLMGRLLLRQGSLSDARGNAVRALQRDVEHPAALALLVEIKSQRDRVVGLWWRFHAWLGPFGSARSLLVLGIIQLAVALLHLVLTDLGLPSALRVLEGFWAASLAYSWRGPVLFRHRLDEELGQVRL